MKLSFAVLLLSLLVATIATDTCLERVNPVGEGSPCSSASTCGYGLFCSSGKGRDGTCQKIRKAGESCLSDNECDVNFQCIGPNDNKICVKNANPGEACSSSSDSTIARCVTGCDPVTNKCTNGNVGDICTADADCLKPLTCGMADGSKESTCLPIADGVNCTTSAQCKPGSYCTTTDRKCTPQKISGECSSTSECASGYTCARKTRDDQRQCVLMESFVAGSYCEESEECQSKRCFKGFCATKEASICQSSDDCTYDQTCRCSGNIISSGFGTCVTNPCIKLTFSLYECAKEKCRTDVSIDYDNSCVFKNCGSKYISYLKCSSASNVIISAMTIVFALFAVAFVF